MAAKWRKSEDAVIASLAAHMMAGTSQMGMGHAERFYYDIIDRAQMIFNAMRRQKVLCPIWKI